MGKPILIIDPGHGGTDPGAAANGIQEKDYVLQISLYQLERFKQLGIPAAITRTDDQTLDSGPRTQIVRDSGAKYCISNHLNAAGTPTAAGAEVIHSLYSNGQLAHKFMDALVACGLPKRRVFYREGKNGDYYYMHRETGTIETLIVEYDFITNAEGAQRIKANWKKYAEAIVKTFALHAGYNYTPPAAPKPAPKDWKQEGLEWLQQNLGVSDSWKATDPVDMGTLGTILKRMGDK
jgi:N-acetylmuramoyl-L-alanine amidase